MMVAEFWSHVFFYEKITEIPIFVGKIMRLKISISRKIITKLQNRKHPNVVKFLSNFKYSNFVSNVGVSKDDQ